jgi:predicted phosphodiesterase
MTVIVTADLHWNDNPRDAYRHQYVEWLEGCLKKHKAEALFILGDLTDAKDEHRSWLVNQVVAHLTRWARLCPVIIIRGNHDFLSPDWPFFGFVDKLHNVHWVNWPMNYDEIALKMELSIGRFVMLPHTSDYKKEWAEFDFGKYEWVFTHNTFTGSDYGQGPLAKGIPPDVFPDSCVVLSGDVHIPQHVKPVTYVGAPYLIDFGDDYDPRVMLIGRGSVKSILVDGPQKRLVEIKSLADLKKVKLAGGDMVKVRLNLATEDRSKWPEMQTAIKQWAEKQGLVLSSSQPMVAREPGLKRVRIYDDKLLVRDYVKSRGADAATEKTGLRLMEKA